MTRKRAPKKQLQKPLPPLHPGEVLREEFLIPLDISAGALANEETGVTADTALRLSRAFGTTAALWLNLQNSFDVQMAEREIGKELRNITPVTGHAA
jgi:plasmid maintenance system antidote protein VapI